MNEHPPFFMEMQLQEFIFLALKAVGFGILLFIIFAYILYGVLQKKKTSNIGILESIFIMLNGILTGLFFLGIVTLVVLLFNIPLPRALESDFILLPFIGVGIYFHVRMLQKYKIKNIGH